MRRLRRTVLFALAVTLSNAAVLTAESSSRAREIEEINAVRARLFAGRPEELVSLALNHRARWTVLFAPSIEECTPQEVHVTKALKRLALEFADLVVVTLIPEGLPRRLIERGVFGQSFPGRLVEVPAKSWRSEERVGPRPRIEVWSGRGELLLMRSVPSSVSEEAIYEELLWARSFTTQMAEPSPGEQQ